MKIKLINRQSKNQGRLERLAIFVDLIKLKSLLKKKKVPFIDEKSVVKVNIIYVGQVNFSLNKEPANHYTIIPFYRDSERKLKADGEINYFLR